MNICTITCHHVYNYGASLQAFALQHYLESQGHTVRIIDFNPWYHQDRYNIFWGGYGIQGWRQILNDKYSPLKYLYRPFKAWKNGMFKTWGRKAAFDIFEEKHYHLTRRSYTTSKELVNDPPYAECYIAGSDQIWNTYSLNGKEPAYYLDFGSEDTKRISYAASLATPKIADGWETFVKEKVLRFNSVSVREASGMDILTKLKIKDVMLVVDPVFLLDRTVWRNLYENSTKEYGLNKNSYLLVYDFLGNDLQMSHFIAEIAKNRNLKIVSINDFSPREYADLNINDAGPLEFLDLIDNAACIVANSFHATAFSVIFQKEFYTFGLLGHNNSNRMLDFLDLIGLRKHFEPKSLQKNIDYDTVECLLNGEIGKSRNFLKYATTTVTVSNDNNLLEY